MTNNRKDELMSSELTTKTNVVVTRIGDFWVSPEQGQNVMKIQQDDPNGSIVLEDNLISCRSIDGVLTAEKYAELNYKRRGGWQCKFNVWHERGQQCAHTRSMMR